LFSTKIIFLKINFVKKYLNKTKKKKKKKKEEKKRKEKMDVRRRGPKAVSLSRSAPKPNHPWTKDPYHCHISISTCYRTPLTAIPKRKYLFLGRIPDLYTTTTSVQYPLEKC
jgi:hypothetical protein